MLIDVCQITLHQWTGIAPSCVRTLALLLLRTRAPSLPSSIHPSPAASKSRRSRAPQISLPRWQRQAPPADTLARWFPAITVRRLFLQGMSDELFDMIDDDNSGTIDIVEFKNFSRQHRKPDDDVVR